MEKLPIKPGPKTSEFKSKYLLQAIIALGAFLTAVDIIPASVAEQLIPWIIMLVIPEAGYSISRGLAKSKR